jgi:hypothetical protein
MYLAASALIAARAKTGIGGCYGRKEVAAIKNWEMFDRASLPKEDP